MNTPRPAVALLALSLACPAARAAAQTPAVWDSVARTLRTPAVPSAGYVRYNFPRRDITLRMGRVVVAPALALGAWLGFAGDPADAMMMGDLVLKPEELRAVLAALAEQVVPVTAVHNHLVGEMPRLIYVHVHAQGPAMELAARMDRVLAVTGTPRPVVGSAPAPVTIDTARVFAALGHGRASGAVAQVSLVLVPVAVTMEGRPLVPALAYASPVNVQAVSATRVVATGDLAVPGPKVFGVVSSFATHGITTTAVHSHLIGETPHVYYIHFWADGPRDEVLAGLRAAVDAAH
jgi:hypothetical protein